MSDTVEKHLYLIMWPNYALVGSNLPPSEFGKHYTLGSSRYFHGQVVFAEIDPDYRHDFLQIDKYIDQIVPTEAGKPKRTRRTKAKSAQPKATNKQQLAMDDLRAAKQLIQATGTLAKAKAALDAYADLVSSK